MKTTLTPPPTAEERRMLAEWVGRFAQMVYSDGQHAYSQIACFENSESMLKTFRNHYGVTSEQPESLAEHHPHPQLTEEQFKHIENGGKLRLEWVMEPIREAKPADITLKDFHSAYIESLQSENARLREALGKLQAFKDYVHKRLDDAGIPTHPDGEHSKAGCRIGDRLDIALKGDE